MIRRDSEWALKKLLRQGESILLLGARQTGKTTLLRLLCPKAVLYDFADPGERLRVARDPGLLIREIRGRLPKGGLFAIDEIQKIPAVFDAVQVLLDDPQKRYQAFLTGSSARKIKRGAVNTLPGRIIQWHLGPLSASETGYYSLKSAPERDAALLDMMSRGNLPRLRNRSSSQSARHLRSYVQTYLEEEILGDALTREIGSFSRFLTIAAARSGMILNYSTLSQESGVHLNTIKHHVGVLSDTMTAYLVPGFSLSDTKTWLSTPKFLLFDLGVRNAASERILEAKALTPEYGTLFEQWVGLEFVSFLRNQEPPMHLYYWRTTSRREIDWLVRSDRKVLAVEVKWSENWSRQDLTHLEAFRNQMRERGYAMTTWLICRTPHPANEGTHQILPPHHLHEAFEKWRLS